MIRFEAVTKQYPDGTVAVDHLDLTAPSRQITVLVGPSGCGKTTSLRMINRMIEPTGGRIFIDDQDAVQGLADRTAARHRLRDPARRAVPAPHRRRQRRDRAVPARPGQEAGAGPGDGTARARRACRPNFAKRYPAQLSGGQQQRVGVARALAADPPVMLMDEPFSAVDPVVRAQLQDEFLRLQAELGKTIVFVTHDIDEAIKLGDQVAVLRVGGKLAQLATPAELLSQPGRRVRRRLRRPRPRLPRARLRRRPARSRCRTSRRPRSAGTWPRPRTLPRDGWVLVVDEQRAPRGWLARQRRLRRRAAPGTCHEDLLNLGGTLARQARHAARGARRGAVLAQRPRRGRRRGRRPARHRHRVRGPGARSSSATPPARTRTPEPDARGDADDRLPTPNSSPWHFWGYFQDHRHEDLGWLWDHVWLSAAAGADRAGRSRCRSAGWPAATGGCIRR